MRKELKSIIIVVIIAIILTIFSLISLHNHDCEGFRRIGMNVTNTFLGCK